MPISADQRYGQLHVCTPVEIIKNLKYDRMQLNAAGVCSGSETVPWLGAASPFTELY
jgi:hypothetical protein